MFTMRIHQSGVAAALAALVLISGAASAGEPQRVPPTVVHPAPDDLDGNRIADLLDEELQQREPDDLVRVIVSLKEPTAPEHRAAFEASGGELRHVYEHVMYGLSGRLPAGQVRGLVNQLGEKLNVVRLDRSGTPQIDHSTSQIRVKDWHPFDSDDAYVWTYGYTGDPNSSVAIAGSGITVAHDDLGDSPDDDIEGDSDDWGDANDPTNVVIGWHDSTPDASTSPRDINGHETLVAGVVAGQGVLNSDLVGVAPDTRLVGLKFGYINPSDPNEDLFYASDFIECCNWVLEDDGTGVMNRDRYGIKVLNLSTLWDGDYGTTQAVETLVANGVVVAVSGGNGHDDGSGDPLYYVAYPARSPKVISVGATTTDFQGADFVERISAYSSNGDPGESVIKPDIVAPGGNICCSGGSITAPNINSTVVFDNLGGCYDDANATVVRGPNAPDGQADFAFQFLATESGGVDRMWIAVGEHNGNGSFHLTVWFADDNNDVPGAQNGGAWNLQLSHAGIWWSSGNGSTVLTAGQRYWLCMAVPASSPAQEVDWYKNAMGDGGTGAIYYPSSQTWAPFMDIRSAFRVRINASGDAYQRGAGTSFAAPHVAGVAALLIQAIEANGSPWQYTESEVMQVKALLQITATETVFAGQDPEDCGGPSDPQNNTVDRGGKDRVEGYGRMNPDAAVEAATMTWNLSGTEQADLGESEWDKKCWARQVTLSAASNVHEITLDVPGGADFDLYLYALNPAANGEPIVVRSSTTASTDDATNDEQICISVDVDTDYYVVVKWVEGNGTFTLSYTSISVSEICDNGVDDDCDGLVDGDDPDCDGGPGGLQLVVNGDFGTGELSPWTAHTSSNPGHPEPQITIEDIDPFDNSLRIFREIDFDGSGADVRQQLDASVSPDSAITLEFDVRIDSHNFGGYNSWNVYPANVWVIYEDALGDTYTFRRSFYNYVAPGHTPDPEPLAEQIDLGMWVHRIFDLSDVSPAIAQITRIQAGSQGWSYDVAFDNISLLVEQPAPCPGDLDGDEDTDLSDLAALLAAYGSGPDDPNWNPAADFDSDEDVDLSDLAFLLSDYGCSG